MNGDNANHLQSGPVGCLSHGPNTLAPGGTRTPEGHGALVSWALAVVGATCLGSLPGLHSDSLDGGVTLPCCEEGDLGWSFTSREA